jgi:hypothetical protein
MIEQFWSTRSMIVILKYFMIASPVLVVIKLGSTNFILIMYKVKFYTYVVKCS